MIVNENYALDSFYKQINVPKGIGYPSLDFDLDLDYKNNITNGNVQVSFWFKPDTKFDKDKMFAIYFKQNPFPIIGSFTYPSNKNEWMFFELKRDINLIPNGYKPEQVFIGFDSSRDGGNAFMVKKFKIEIGNDYTLYIPNKNDVKPVNQAIFLSGGYSRKCIRSSKFGGGVC